MDTMSPAEAEQPCPRHPPLLTIVDEATSGLNFCRVNFWSESTQKLVSEKLRCPTLCFPRSIDCLCLVLLRQRMHTRSSNPFRLDVARGFPGCLKR